MTARGPCMPALLLILIHIMPVAESSEMITGFVGYNVTLPCSYDARNYGQHDMCWGRGEIPLTGGCDNEIIATDGFKVTRRKSHRYQLIGDLNQGDVSLTIIDAEMGDSGIYGCRVQIRGLFNDLKTKVTLTIQSAESSEMITGFVGYSVTLPCSYDAWNYREFHLCWGRDEIPESGCKNEIIVRDRRKVTQRKSHRYQLIGDLKQGDASLTIINAEMGDSGIYGCHVKIPGPFNDVKTKVTLTIQSAESSEMITGFVGYNVTLPCSYDAWIYREFRLCWGRDEIPESGCKNEIIVRDRHKVTQRKSHRYQLIGDLNQGDASLTIINAEMGDSGIYGCLVELPGPSNDVKTKVTLTIQIAESSEMITGFVGYNVTLPCSYDAKKSGQHDMCWRRGEIPLTGGCGNEIIATDGFNVTWRKSHRYQLIGDLNQGDVSLTIIDAEMGDSGIYGCLVRIPGWFNDQKTQVTLTIQTDIRKSTVTPTIAASSTTQTAISVTSGYYGNYSTGSSAANTPQGSAHADRSFLIIVPVAVILLLLLLLVLVTGLWLHKRKQQREARSAPEVEHQAHTSVHYGNVGAHIGFHTREMATENIYEERDFGDYESCP
ncbi:uncharacterized protein LOC125720116 isoform X1 [Brienomyrus brachyistius]|uniref:uncharacterized protein LOC125720116 isoform X1 n=1 Tax=Brienomyrus brachyistius TaxID=42636 RepID=UPI0020B1D133|nr:uncharacterized protein LOC125720116 isoform X1 [Brienomyrus brachyistius]